MSRVQIAGNVRAIGFTPFDSQPIFYVSHTPYLRAFLWKNTEKSEGKF